MPSAAFSLRERIADWLNDRPDDHVLRWLFALLIAATIAAVGWDYAELMQKAERQASMPADILNEPAPKPSAQPLPARRGSERRLGGLRTADKRLAAPMTFELANDGRLLATGMIMPGAAAAFAAEIEKRGGYVKTVVLHSSGGSVQDALKIGRLIREKKFNTEVENGGYCASSCPLVFAGGVERVAGPKAAIGVHQIFAAAAPAGATVGDGMSNAQRVSAECQRYLREMGVDSEVWVHAMETPKDELFYFKPDELLTLKLATSQGGVKSAGKV